MRDKFCHISALENYVYKQELNLKNFDAGDDRQKNAFYNISKDEVEIRVD